MILSMLSVGFYEDHNEFWEKEKQAAVFFENQFKRKFDPDIDDLDHELIYKYFNQLPDLYHIEYHNFTTGFEVYKVIE